MAGHDDLAFRVRLYHELGRTYDAIDSLDLLIADSCVLSDEDRHLFSCVYKSAFDSLRQGVRHLTSIYKAELEEGHSDRAEKLREFQERAFADLDRLCERALSAINEHLLPNSPNARATAFYHKLVGDFSRYHSECAPESEMPKLLEKAKKNYDRSIEICAKELPLRDSLRLSVILNHAVFQYEHLHRKEDAAELIRAALEEIDGRQAGEGGEQEPEILATLEIMRRNIRLWGDNKE
jgi:hypothetical protein